MLLKFLKSKLFILFLIILFTAFILGYDYAVVASKGSSTVPGSKSIQIPETSSTPYYGNP
jgi:hypothetical protein